MEIVFLSNYLNHHQKPISDILYKITKGNYWFVATSQMDDERKNLGYKEIDAPYLITCYNEQKPNHQVTELINRADAVIIGSAPDSYIEKRCKDNKLVFKYTERLYKQRPGLLKLLVHRIRFKRFYDKNPNCYLLCASAFTASDFKKIGCFENRAFKWGYFPVVPDNDIDELWSNKESHKYIKILWVGRFLHWKHPELAVSLGERLSQEGIGYEINMYGIGPELETVRKMISQKGLIDNVKLHGSADNERIISEMKGHDIFIFTSDRNEGWGAVANEAMSNGCTIVASEDIGSIPYLINTNENGLIFKSGDSNDLYDKVILLLNNKELRKQMARAAYQTMKNIWSPQNAAEALIVLINRLVKHKTGDVVYGPCSKA